MVHAAAEVLLGDVATHRVLIAIFGQAAHVPDHDALATALMIQWEAAALGWRWREQLLRERVRGHTTPLHGHAEIIRECANTSYDEYLERVRSLQPPRRFAILADRDPDPQRSTLLRRSPHATPRQTKFIDECPCRPYRTKRFSAPPVSSSH